MKLTKAVLLVCAVMLLLPASGYALLDVGVYGGYSFAGKIETDTESMKTSGPGFGVFGHYTTGLPLMLSFGIGPFYQKTYLSYDLANKEYEATRSMLGVDVFLQLELPIIVHPYVRVGIAVKEWLEIDDSSGSSTKSEYFKSYYGGPGVAFKVFPLVSIFGEYLYTRSKQEDGIVLKGSAVHAGAKLTL
ncbi:MAG TPA: outer membrane beta-barrel protein [Spirochaetota bacterium]|nr:outer membrane beta-barrel protein [Spirochaetota bacterium]